MSENPILTAAVDFWLRLGVPTQRIGNTFRRPLLRLVLKIHCLVIKSGFPDML